MPPRTAWRRLNLFAQDAFVECKNTTFSFNLLVFYPVIEKEIRHDFSRSHSRIYSLFAGQPLALLNATGPVLVFEGILYSFCR